MVDWYSYPFFGGWCSFWVWYLEACIGVCPDIGFYLGYDCLRPGGSHLPRILAEEFECPSTYPIIVKKCILIYIHNHIYIYITYNSSYNQGIWLIDFPWCFFFSLAKGPSGSLEICSLLQVVALILPAWRRHILEKVIVEETKNALGLLSYNADILVEYEHDCGSL